MMLENRTALVTGGESGIGAACVTALAAAGANVAVLYFKDRAKAEVSCGSAEAQGRRSVAEIGRASCRERVCQYVLISVVAVSLIKKYSIGIFYRQFFLVNIHNFIY